jgi:hypothetical protein
MLHIRGTGGIDRQASTFTISKPARKETNEEEPSYRAVNTSILACVIIVNVVNPADLAEKKLLIEFSGSSQAGEDRSKRKENSSLHVDSLDNGLRF